MNVAVIGAVDAVGIIEEMRIAVGSVTPTPCRMSAAEELLVGHAPDLETMERAARAVSQEMIRRSGTRASTEYKKPAVEGLVIKALAEVFEVSHG
jgi:CO/xanthine dehydrogenase FAD-binding subunit